MAQYKSRDPQNPYRTGCLVGNYVEDKFGREIAEKGEVSICNWVPDCWKIHRFGSCFSKSEWQILINVTSLFIETNLDWNQRKSSQIPRRQLSPRLRYSKKNPTRPTRGKRLPRLLAECRIQPKRLATLSSYRTWSRPQYFREEGSCYDRQLVIRLEKER